VRRAPITMAVVLSLTGFAQAGEERPVSMNEVPTDVLDVIRSRFDNVELLSANTETEEDGSIVYEVQGRIPAGQWVSGERSPLIDADGDLVAPLPQAPTKLRRIEFDLTPNAVFDEIEIEFTVNLVPGAVIQALQAKYPGFEPTFIEASYSDSMDVTRYEFEGRHEGRSLDLEVSASGRKIRVADR